MDYEKLKSEIENDPENLGYSGTNKEVTDLLNNNSRVKFVDASKDSVLKYLIKNQKWLAIADSTNDAARNVVALLNTQSFDVNGAESTFLIDALVTLNLLDSDDKSYIQNLGQENISRTQELGLSKIKEGHVEGVRK